MKNLFDVFSPTQFFAVFIFFLCGIILSAVFCTVRYRKKIKAARSDAVKRSRAVLGGQFGEQMAPFLPGFPCNPGDAHFIGKPVDFIAFTGSAEGKDISEILFIEVKSGSSALSEREKQVKNAVQSGKVRYVEYRI